MASEQFTVGLSEIDEARWDQRTAKAVGVTRETVPALLDYCRTRDVRFLIARCSADDIPAAQALERAGCLLMDTLVYYARPVTPPPAPPTHAASVLVATRTLAPGDEDAVARIAGEAFHQYLGHYHADPRLDPDACDEVYVSWARAECAAHIAALGATRAVLMAGEPGEVRGFITLRLNGPDEGEGVLFAVDPASRRQGIAAALMTAALHWCREQGAERMIISTQLKNHRVQRVWASLGFVLSDASYTFHKWFDAE